MTAADKIRGHGIMQAARNGHEQVVKHLYRDIRAKFVSE